MDSKKKGKKEKIFSGSWNRLRTRWKGDGRSDGSSTEARDHRVRVITPWKRSYSREVTSPNFWQNRNAIIMHYNPYDPL